MKIHKVSTEHFNDALEFQKQNGFVNPAVVLIVPECGTEPMRFTDKWRVTDCKRCLAKRPKKRGGK